MQNDSSFKCTYLPYNDTGNISLYLNTKDQDAAGVESLLRDYMSELAFTITDQDAERSKQILWMTIMQLESDYDLSQEVGNQLVYLGKRLSRRKWATIVTKLATKENL
jgi:predicted Zn-dependent peptidase